MSSTKEEPQEFEENQEPLLNDIRDYLLNTKSDTLLQKLQTLHVLPTEPSELQCAIQLLSECDRFYRDTNYYPNPVVDGLILTTIAHAQEKGWGNLYATYQASAHNHYH
jgi:hypothetical protein